MVNLGYSYNERAVREIFKRGENMSLYSSHINLEEANEKIKALECELLKRNADLEKTLENGKNQIKRLKNKIIMQAEWNRETKTEMDLKNMELKYLMEKCKRLGLENDIN